MTRRGAGLLALAGVVLAIAAGTAVSAPTWTRPAIVAPAGSSYSEAQVAVSRRGDGVVAYLREISCCRSRGALFVRLRERASGAWSARVKLQRTGAESPAVGVSPLGEGIVAWVNGSQVRAAIKMRGRRWATSNVAAASATVVAMRAAIDVGGRARVVWVERLADGSETVHGAGFESGAWTVDATIPAVDASGDIALALAPRGYAVAAWAAADGSVSAFQRSAGGWSATTASIAPAGDATRPLSLVSAAVAPAGQALVAWMRRPPSAAPGSPPGVVEAGMLADPSGTWEAPRTLAGDALAFTAPAVALENGAAIAWPGACVSEQRPIGSAYRATTTDPWTVIPSPSTLLVCTDLDQGMVSQVGVVRGPRLVVLAPTDVGGGPDTALAAVGTVPGVWSRALLPGDESVTDLATAGRFALVVWSRPEDGTALRIREYRAPLS